MNEASAEKRCPKCGAPILAEALQGLCPRCVLAGAATETDAGSPSAHRPAPPPLEDVRAAFPQFEVIELIGAGGMGAVFKARQPKLDRLVALKLLSEPLGKHPAFAERFHREARVLAKLNHPNIVSVFDFGEAGGFFYLLMEFVDGVNLRQAMRAGRFSPAQALEIVPKICEALQFAHEHGILHRDIKPENILLDQKGRVKIADFGIAKLVGTAKADVTLTASGASLGTPAYMAPEQIEKPGEVDHRADIYSLGVVFYEMLTGELPLGRFAPPSKKTPLDERVDDIVLRALAKERELRQQSAEEVKTEVEGVAGASGPGQAARGLAGAPIPAARDFILCNPRLPRMAQAITVYGLLVAPFLWALGLTLLDFEHLAEHPGAAAIEGMWLFFGNVLGGLATTIVLLVGALKLRVLRTSGPVWVRAGIWSRIALAAVGVLVLVWAAVLDWDSEGAAGRIPVAEGVVLGVSLLACGFEIAMLVWLRRNRAVLDGLCRSAQAEAAAAQPSGPTPPDTLPRTSWKATLSAVLAIPLWLHAGWMSLLGLVSLFRRDAGLSLIDGLGTFDGLLTSFGGFLSLAGLILGVLALGDIRRGHGRLRGTGLALMGALGAPFNLALTLTPGLLLTLGAAGYLPASVGRRLYEVAPLWLVGLLAVVVVRLKRWVERPGTPGATAGGRTALAFGAGAVALLVLLPSAAMFLGTLTPMSRVEAPLPRQTTNEPAHPSQVGATPVGQHPVVEAGPAVGPVAGRFRMDFGVPAGQGVLIEMVTSRSNGVHAIPGSAAYYLASAQRDGAAVFLWLPDPRIPTRTGGARPWQLEFRGEGGAFLASATNLTLPEDLARLIPSGGFTMDRGWLSPEAETTHWLVERTAAERPGLGVRLRTFAHGLGLVELGERGFAGAGTNWEAEFPQAIRTPPPVFRYSEIVPQPVSRTNRQSALFRIPGGLKATFEIWTAAAPPVPADRGFEVEVIASTNQARVVRLEWGALPGRSDAASRSGASWEVRLCDDTSGEELKRFTSPDFGPVEWRPLALEAARVKEADGYPATLLEGETTTANEGNQRGWHVSLYYGAEPLPPP